MHYGFHLWLPWLLIKCLLLLVAFTTKSCRNLPVCFQSKGCQIEIRKNRPFNKGEFWQRCAAGICCLVWISLYYPAKSLRPIQHLMVCLRSEDAFVITCVANLMEVKVLYVQQDLPYEISSYWRFDV
jgi:hypothetical protein